MEAFRYHRAVTIDKTLPILYTSAAISPRRTVTQNGQKGKNSKKMNSIDL